MDEQMKRYMDKANPLTPLTPLAKNDKEKYHFS